MLIIKLDVYGEVRVWLLGPVLVSEGHGLAGGVGVAFAPGSRMEHFALRNQNRAELRLLQLRLFKNNVGFFCLFEQINRLRRRKRRRKRKAKRYYLIP